MRIFDHPNMTDFRCPICGKSTDEPVTLVRVYGTERDGIMQAWQYHVRCLDLMVATKISGTAHWIAMGYMPEEAEE